MIVIRKEREADRSAVREVNELAFGRPEEAELVDAVRRTGAFFISLVAEEKGAILGHAFFTPVRISAEDGSFPAIGLGPVAVRPERQRQGIGTTLIEQGLAACRAAGYGVAVVLGHPEYYPRFGFEPAAVCGIRFSTEVPEEAFMVMALRPGALKGVQGVARYLPAFEGV